jgi:hypothetical protein
MQGVNFFYPGGRSEIEQIPVLGLVRWAENKERLMTEGEEGL